MNRIILVAIVCASVALPAITATAQSNRNRDRTISISDGDPATNEWSGFYGKTGIAIGVPNNPKGSRTKAGAGAAVQFGGGYRFNPFLAFELDMTLTAGHDVKRSNDDLLIFAFMMNSKIYPFATSDIFPDLVQPYAKFGFGGGVADAGDLNDESSFMMQFAFGTEAMFWDHFGLYAEGGYITFDDPRTGLEGSGNIIFGALYRF